MNALQALTLARENNLTGAALHPLLLLLEDSPLCPNQIAKRMRCHVANVTGLADRLEKDGWITRTPHPGDRRKHYLCPTEKAFEIFTPAIETP